MTMIVRKSNPNEMDSTDVYTPSTSRGVTVTPTIVGQVFHKHPLEGDIGEIVEFRTSRNYVMTKISGGHSRPADLFGQKRELMFPVVWMETSGVRPFSLIVSGVAQSILTSTTDILRRSDAVISVELPGEVPEELYRVEISLPKMDFSKKIFWLSEWDIYVSQIPTKELLKLVRANHRIPMVDTSPVRVSILTKKRSSRTVFYSLNHLPILELVPEFKPDLDDDQVIVEFEDGTVLVDHFDKTDDLKNLVETKTFHWNSNVGIVLMLDTDRSRLGGGRSKIITADSVVDKLIDQLTVDKHKLEKEVTELRCQLDIKEAKLNEEVSKRDTKILILDNKLAEVTSEERRRQDELKTSQEELKLKIAELNHKTADMQAIEKRRQDELKTIQEELKLKTTELNHKTAEIQAIEKRRQDELKTSQEAYQRNTAAINQRLAEVLAEQKTKQEEEKTRATEIKAASAKTGSEASLVSDALKVTGAAIAFGLLIFALIKKYKTSSGVVKGMVEWAGPSFGLTSSFVSSSAICATAIVGTVVTIGVGLVILEKTTGIVSKTYESIMGSDLMEDMKAVSRSMKESVGGVVDVVKDTASFVVDATKTVVSKVVDVVKDTASFVGSSTKRIVVCGWNTASKIVSATKEVVSNVVTKVAETVSSAVDYYRGVVGNVGGFLTSCFGW